MAGQLRDRAATAAGNGVAQREPDLRAQIKSMEAQFQLAMPKGVEAAQLVRDAMTVLSANPGLARVDARSVLGALMTCAQLGLRPGVLGQAWVIPFKGKGQLIIGYQGLIALAQRSGDIASISARMVHANDHYDYEFGLNDNLVHKPLMAGDRGDVIAYYCVVKTKSGGAMWDVLSRADAERHRDKFAMAKKDGAVVGPWKDHFDAMALKTIMRVLKLAPRSTELQTAIVADSSVRVDVTPTAMADQVSVPLGIDDGIEDADVVDEPAGEPDFSTGFGSDADEGGAA